VLIGSAVIIVSGKLAQFGNRLLVPVSDAMIGQFVENFRVAAAAVPTASASGAAAPTASTAAPQPVKELNALALMWTVFKTWLAGLFGKRT
jgi:hypothetical protein